MYKISGVRRFFLRVGGKIYCSEEFSRTKQARLFINLYSVRIGICLTQREMPPSPPTGTAPLFPLLSPLYTIHIYRCINRCIHTFASIEWYWICMTMFIKKKVRPPYPFLRLVNFYIEIKGGRQGRERKVNTLGL